MKTTLLQKKEEIKLAKAVNVRLSEDAHAALGVAARMTRRTMADWAGLALEESLRAVQRSAEFKQQLEDERLTPVTTIERKKKAQGAA